MTILYPSSSSGTSRPAAPSPQCLPSAVLLLSLFLAVLLLPSSLALPLSPSRPNRDSHRRGPQHSNGLSTPHSASSDAQSDLSPHPHSHLQPSTPSPVTAPASPSHPLARPDAVDEPERAAQGAVDATPPPPPPRIRAQPHEGGLYAAQKKAKQVREHAQSPSEPAPAAEPESTEACLTAEQLAAAKKEARAKLLTVMEQYLAAWQAEERTEDEIETLYDEKKDELKVRLTAKKEQLMARACPDAQVAGTKQSHGGRRLMGLEDDDWLDQEEDKVYLIEENSTPAEDSPSLLDDDEQVGAVAHIVAGGSRRSESEDAEAPRFDASVHPFAMPSAFTSLSERDIEAIHSPPPPPQPKAQPASPAADHDIGELAFVASISPARYSPAPLDNPPVIVVGQRSQRDMDEDLEEERRRRRDRLKEIRSRSSNNAPVEPNQPVPRGSLPLSDEELPPGGFVASISPMAPQHTTPDYDDAEGAHAYIGSISAPSLNGGAAANGNANSGQRGGMSLEERWRREEEEERKTEEGGGVWRSGSRGRLERTVGRGRQS